MGKREEDDDVELRPVTRKIYPKVLADELIRIRAGRPTNKIYPKAVADELKRELVGLRSRESGISGPTNIRFGKRQLIKPLHRDTLAAIAPVNIPYAVIEGIRQALFEMNMRDTYVHVEAISMMAKNLLDIILRGAPIKGRVQPARTLIRIVARKFGLGPLMYYFCPPTGGAMNLYHQKYSVTVSTQKTLSGNLVPFPKPSSLAFTKSSFVGTFDLNRDNADKISNEFIRKQVAQGGVSDEPILFDFAIGARYVEKRMLTNVGLAFFAVKCIYGRGREEKRSKPILAIIPEIAGSINLSWPVDPIDGPGIDYDELVEDSRNFAPEEKLRFIVLPPRNDFNETMVEDLTLFFDDLFDGETRSEFLRRYQRDRIVTAEKYQQLAYEVFNIRRNPASRQKGQRYGCLRYIIDSRQNVLDSAVFQKYKTKMSTADKEFKYPSVGLQLRATFLRMLNEGLSMGTFSSHKQMLMPDADILSFAMPKNADPIGDVIYFKKTHQEMKAVSGFMTRRTQQLFALSNRKIFNVASQRSVRTDRPYNLIVHGKEADWQEEHRPFKKELGVLVGVEDCIVVPDCDRLNAILDDAKLNLSYASHHTWVVQGKIAMRHVRLPTTNVYALAGRMGKTKYRRKWIHPTANYGLMLHREAYILYLRLKLAAKKLLRDPGVADHKKLEDRLYMFTYGFFTVTHFDKGKLPGLVDRFRRLFDEVAGPKGRQTSRKSRFLEYIRHVLQDDRHQMVYQHLKYALAKLPRHGKGGGMDYAELLFNHPECLYKLAKDDELMTRWYTVIPSDAHKALVLHLACLWATRCVKLGLPSESISPNIWRLTHLLRQKVEPIGLGTKVIELAVKQRFSRQVKAGHPLDRKRLENDYVEYTWCWRMYRGKKYLRALSGQTIEREAYTLVGDDVVKSNSHVAPSDSPMGTVFVEEARRSEEIVPVVGYTRTLTPAARLARRILGYIGRGREIRHEPRAWDAPEEYIVQIQDESMIVSQSEENGEAAAYAAETNWTIDDFGGGGDCLFLSLNADKDIALANQLRRAVVAYQKEHQLISQGTVDNQLGFMLRNSPYRELNAIAGRVRGLENFPINAYYDLMAFQGTDAGRREIESYTRLRGVQVIVMESYGTITSYVNGVGTNIDRLPDDAFRNGIVLYKNRGHWRRVRGPRGG